MTTQKKFGKFSVLVFLSVLIASVSITFAHPKNNLSMDEARPMHLVGHVEKVNNDHTFDFVSMSGQHYKVHMAKDATVNVYMGFRDEKSILTFDDLYKGERISFVANPL